MPTTFHGSPLAYHWYANGEGITPLACQYPISSPYVVILSFPLIFKQIFEIVLSM